MLLRMLLLKARLLEVWRRADLAMHTVADLRLRLQSLKRKRLKTTMKKA